MGPEVETYRWEYATVERNSHTGDKDTILFTRPQGSFLDRAREVWGKGVKKDSHDYLIHVDSHHLEVNTILGALGTQGWELVAVTEWPGSIKYYFKRPYSTLSYSRSEEIGQE